MKKCTDCRYCIQQDYGYSNWTVEGTDVDCLLKKNPDFPADRFYEETPSLTFAESCNKFSEGGSVYIDVDQEDGALENYSDDLEIKKLLAAL